MQVKSGYDQITMKVIFRRFLAREWPNPCKNNLENLQLITLQMYITIIVKRQPREQFFFDPMFKLK